MFATGGIWYYTINEAMEENTVFGGSNAQTPSSGDKSSSTAPVVQAPVASPPQPSIPQVVPSGPAAPPLTPAPIAEIKPTPSSATAGPLPPPGLPNTPASSSSRFSLGKIIKILGILIGFVAVLFIVFGLILPNFTKKSNEQVTLSYWGLWENENVMKSVIDDFQKQNPNIKVNYEKRDIKQYRETLRTRIRNGSGPDVYLYHNTWLPMFSDVLVPLSNDVITKENFQKNYYSVIQHDVVKNGGIYGIPTGIDVLALYINKDIFSAAGLDVPTTWDGFINTARKLTVKDEEGKIKTAGAAMGTFDNINNASDIVSLLLLQNGAELSNLQKTTQNASDALNFYTSFSKDDGAVWDETLDPSLLMFSKGNLAMYFGYSFDIFTIKAANPNLPFEIHPVPHLPNRNITVASYWVNGVSGKSKHQKEAMLFMKFLTQKETEQKLFSEASKTRLFGQPYARLDLADSLKDNQYVYPFVKQAPDGASSFFASNTHDNGINSQMNAYLGNAVRSILNNTSAESAVETLAQGVAQVLQQYGQ